MRFNKKNRYKLLTELLQKYLDEHKSWRPSTRNKKEYIIDAVNHHPLSTMKICDIKTSNIKAFYLALYEKGLTRQTIVGYGHVLRPAFEMAVQDDWIRKNPCKFKLDFLPITNKQKVALTPKEESLFLDFVQTNEKLAWYYDIYVLMLETGIRLSELCGLTLDDIDMKERRISINKQMCVPAAINGVRKLRIDVLKTDNGEREIFISDQAYTSLTRLLKRRKDNNFPERIIDGYSKFLLTSNRQSGIVTHAMIDYNLNKAVTLYNESHKQSLPHITPHIFRHTFCTRMIEKGMDIKTLQYLMGHADVKTTLDVYTHLSADTAVSNMAKVVAK